MTPGWMTIEKLVTELGGVCSARYEVLGGARAEAIAGAAVDEAVRRATQAVTAVLCDPTYDDGAVRTAWTAIARAQDVIAQLRTTVEKSRALRERAQELQDQSLRLRRIPAVPFGDPDRRARRKTDPV